ncbi:hypothetical protein ALC62_01965 [Cyphomyrmex costatus]|uniref:Uncharacterized protein n=1 Tax=Cyphomyrmex costatus TaxID=456900 RepID=A0A151INN6_9HYME|nr:hypothetical protein ALC62_01965 [Cyphomyrmex costatus]
MLNECYDNKRLIIQNHLKAIFELRGTTKQSPVLWRQIVDGTLKHVRALRALGYPTDAWDDMLIHLMLTLKEWQTSLTDATIPSFKQMTEFLLRKCQTLETVSKKAVTSIPADADSKVIKAKNTALFLANVKEKCAICNDEHFIFYCQKFLGLSTDQRFQQVISIIQIRPNNKANQVSVSEIEKLTSQANNIAGLKIGSNYNASQTTIDCMVIDHITKKLSINWIDSKAINVPKNINLAEFNFHISTFWQLTCVGQVKLWHIKDCSNSQAYTREERSCEEYFRQTTQRNEQGRFIVRLSTKEKELERLGKSKSTATKRFYSLERKFRQQQRLKQEYVEFMKEYLTLGHMQKIKDDQEVSNHTYYLLHHAVIKQSPPSCAWYSTLPARQAAGFC